ncbi:MAG: TIGR03943 family protein [Synechococcaceae cyanobacterium]|nr:TIGR03943 family protein [Synechococcaceae cyanobacterium]
MNSQPPRPAPAWPAPWRRAALWRALTLGLWALVLLRSGADGRLDLLLRAIFHPLVSAAGLLLLALAGLQLLLALRDGRAAAETIGRGPLRRLGLTALVALLVLAIPPAPSFADLAGQRPRDETGSEALSFVLPPAQRSLTDWVRLLRSQPDPALHDGDPVRISGFVLPMPEGPPQLARLLVRCCLADATPVGLPVRWPASLPEPQADQWLALEGHMLREQSQGAERLVVVAERVRPIPRPARPLEP